MRDHEKKKATAAAKTSLLQIHRESSLNEAGSICGGGVVIGLLLRSSK